MLFDRDGRGAAYDVEMVQRSGGDARERPQLADKLGGYPFFVQVDAWDGGRPSDLRNVVTWRTERRGDRMTRWAGDGTVLNIWADARQPNALHVEASMG